MSPFLPPGSPREFQGRGRIVGHLQNGVWQIAPQILGRTAFKRESSGFVAGNSSPDIMNRRDKPKLQLIVSSACPWCHYTLLVHSLLGLEGIIELVELNPIVGDQGWCFENRFDLGRGAGAAHLHEVYSAAAPDFSGRATAPVLFDPLSGRIVSNDSSDIGLAMLSASGPNGAIGLGRFTADHADRVYALNSWIYRDLANKVYEIGFCTDQQAYAENIEILFAGLEDLDRLLGERKFLCGEGLTIADLRLFAFLVRFDAVYFIHFKCSRVMIREMQNVSRYLKDVAAVPGVAETISMRQIKQHYFLSHRHLNPSGLVAESGLAFSIVE